MSIFSYALIFVLFFIYTACLIKSKSFVFNIIMIFFGVYYIFPILVYLFLIPYNDFLTMSNEIIFKTSDLSGYAIDVLNILSIYFILACYILIPKIKNDYIYDLIYFYIKQREKFILFVVSIILVIIILINLYLIYIVGGISAFYNADSWHSRFSGISGLVIIMNLKSILPCFGIGIVSLLLVSKRYKKYVIPIVVVFFILYVFGGSNRKFALLSIFILVTISVDLLRLEYAKKYFYICIVSIFFIFQALLILRSASFNFDALHESFDRIKDLIIISEPVGTYSIVISLTNDLISNKLEIGYFYDFFKVAFYPVMFFIDYSQPNVARNLGFYINGNENFTFFPTIILEGLYNGYIIGSMVMSTIFALTARLLIKKINSGKNILSIVFYFIIFNICIVQLIRGYISVSLVYFIMTCIIYFVFKLICGKKFQIL